MRERCALPTPVVVGCRFDALKSNGEVEQGKAQGCNVFAIIKGFAGSGQHKRARAMLFMTTVVYSSVIDAQARACAMDESLRY